MTSKQQVVSDVIKRLAECTRISLSNEREIKQAFMLGVWYKKLPEYTLGYLLPCHNFELKLIDPEAAKVFATTYENIHMFQFISNTGSSWHQCYRDFRALGWKRLKVAREGGRLQHLLRIEGNVEDFPRGYNVMHMLLDISISTCKQVQVGTEMVEKPIFETQCGDLVDIADDDDKAAKYEMPQELPPGPHIQQPEGEDTSLLGVSGLEESQPVKADEDLLCAHGSLSGCCPQSNCLHYIGDDEDSIPF